MRMYLDVVAISAETTMRLPPRCEYITSLTPELPRREKQFKDVPGTAFGVVSFRLSGTSVGAYRPELSELPAALRLTTGTFAIRHAVHSAHAVHPVYTVTSHVTIRAFVDVFGELLQHGLPGRFAAGCDRGTFGLASVVRKDCWGEYSAKNPSHGEVRLIPVRGLLG